MIFTICRDQRTGKPYTDEVAAADEAEYGFYANEAADIEVEIRADGFHKGTGEPDDLDSCDVTGGAKVVDDVHFFDPIEKRYLFDRFVFHAGQIIELTDEELSQAEEQALEEARAEAEPEYSPDGKD